MEIEKDQVLSIEDLKKICDDKNIKYTADVGSRKLLHVEIPKKRKFSILRINNEASEKLIELAPHFYKYKFVEGFEAIWSSEEGILECEIQLANHSISLQRLLNNNLDEDEDKSISIPSYKEGINIEISTASNMFALFTFLRDQNRFVRPIHYFERVRDSSATIKLSGIQIKQHDEALALIKNICSSICFQIDCKTELPVMLVFERQPRPERRQSLSLKNLELSTTEYIYDHEALSLYWYAQSAFGMPLLKYLALYQVVEFYYPVYSEKAAQDRIRNILKNPKFNVGQDKDIAKLLKVTNTSSGLYGTERSQLKATIEACVDMSELREWLNECEDRKAFFNSDKAKDLSKFKINTKVENHDFLDQIVERYYDIRCRIVHTTGMEDGFEVLHPQSKEISNINYDIDVANYIAHQVLISSSKPLI